MMKAKMVVCMDLMKNDLLFNYKIQIKKVFDKAKELVICRHSYIAEAG